MFLCEKIFDDKEIFMDIQIMKTIKRKVPFDYEKEEKEREEDKKKKRKKNKLLIVIII